MRSSVLGSVSIPAEVLISHFKSIFYTDVEPLAFTDPLWPFLDGVGDGPFSDEELVSALRRLNGQAAVGPERVPSSILKSVFNDTKTRAPLLALMNLCFTSGKMPDAWGESEIFVLYKLKGSRDDPIN